MEKRCPACEGRMIDGPEARGAWGCVQCGGVWAGKGVATQVASVLDPNVRELADVAQSYAEKNPGKRALPVPRMCPECRALLKERTFRDVIVDVCVAHGTWFDPGELQRFADARLGSKKKTAAEKEESGPPSHSGADLAADVALGALGLFFAFLTD